MATRDAVSPGPCGVRHPIQRAARGPRTGYASNEPRRPAARPARACCGFSNSRWTPAADGPRLL